MDRLRTALKESAALLEQPSAREVQDKVFALFRTIVEPQARQSGKQRYLYRDLLSIPYDVLGNLDRDLVAFRKLPDVRRADRHAVASRPFADVKKDFVRFIKNIHGIHMNLLRRFYR